MNVLVAGAAIWTMRLFNPYAADLFDFFATAGRYESVAPCFGTRRLDQYFQELAT
jgi:hypothetical protein